jgi:tetratricopeptide (TPR) repeat protein
MDKDWHQNYELGKKAFDEKKYEAALVCLEKVRDEKPDFADVFNMLGLIYYYKGKHRDAVDLFKNAIRINPFYTEASLNLSIVYNELGEIDNAVDVYTGARQAKKDDTHYADPYVKGKLANMHAAIAAIYKDIGFLPEAVDEYRKAISLRPEFVDLRTKLGMVYRELGEHLTSVKELNEALMANDNYIPARVQLGLTYYSMGKLDLARIEWERAIAKKPDDKMAKMYLSLFNVNAQR